MLCRWRELGQLRGMDYCVPAAATTMSGVLIRVPCQQQSSMDLLPEPFFSMVCCRLNFFSECLQSLLNFYFYQSTVTELCLIFSCDPASFFHFSFCASLSVVMMTSGKFSGFSTRRCGRWLWSGGRPWSTGLTTMLWWLEQKWDWQGMEGMYWLIVFCHNFVSNNQSIYRLMPQQQCFSLLDAMSWYLVSGKY